MKRITTTLLFSLIAFASVFAQYPKTTAEVKQQIDTIRNETVSTRNNKTRYARAWDAVNYSMVPRIGPASATGVNTYLVSIEGIEAYDTRAWYFVNFTNENTGPSTLKIGALATLDLKKNVTEALAAGDIKANSSHICYYDGTNLQVVTIGGGGGSTFTDDVTFNLSSGKTFGKYTNGQTAEWTGLTAVEAIEDAAIEYINPVFTAFSVSGQATTVEVGTTLSGSKTFTWSITLNSGVVSTIDLYDITATATLLAGTANDGSQAQTITTIQLNSNGATQSWRGVGNNSSPSGTFNSSAFTVTGRFLRFYGPASALPTNSSEVRALSSSAFHTGATTFTLATGSTLTRFIVALPPGVTISSVIDTSALNADITSSYVLTGTITVDDAGSTGRTYNLYQMTLGGPYSTSHNHSITTAN